MADPKDDKAQGLPFDAPEDAPEFDGETYEPEKDHRRLGAQAIRVFGVMRSGEWMTLREIADASEAPEASVSARLRDFRKKRFGLHDVEKRRTEIAGLYEYRLVVNPQTRLEALGLEAPTA